MVDVGSEPCHDAIHLVVRVGVDLQDLHVCPDKHFPILCKSKEMIEKLFGHLVNCFILP